MPRAGHSSRPRPGVTIWSLVTPPVPAYAAPALAGLLSRLGEGQPRAPARPARPARRVGALAHELAARRGIRVQVAHGTARAMRRLKADAVDLLIATPGDRADPAPPLGARAWTRSRQSLPGLAGELGRRGQHHAADAGPAQGDPARRSTPPRPTRVEALVERYARKALTLGAATGSERAARGPVRTVGVSWARRVSALAELVELLDPASLVDLDRGSRAITRRSRRRSAWRSPSCDW